MDTASRAILAIVGSIVSLAVLSTLLSQKAQTSSVIGAASSGLANLITAAESPVTGSTANTSISSSSSNILQNLLGGISIP